MPTFLPEGLPDSGTLLLYAVDVAARASVVLAGALILAVILRRSGAAARHALWTVTLAGLVALPVLSPLLPTLAVPFPWSPAEAVEGASAVLPADEAPSRAVTMGDAAGPVAEPSGFDEARTEKAGGTFERAAASGAASPVPEGKAGRIGSGWILGSWLLGASVLGLFLGLGLWRARRLFRGAEPARGQAWARTLDRARRAVGLRRPASVALSPDVRTALAAGFWRPVVLLPHSAEAWSPERRDLVLIHELVHLKRGDPVRQVLGRLALALYWFHPLAWLAVRRATLAREEACDEAVLALGHSPTTYARHLVDLAHPDSLPLPALSRVDRPPLEKRIMAILEPRSRKSSASAVVAAVVGTAWALTAAAVGPAGQDGSPTAELLPVASVPSAFAIDPVQTAFPVGSDEFPVPPVQATLGMAPVDRTDASSPVPDGAPSDGSAVGSLSPAPVPPADPGRGCRLRGDGINFADGGDFEGGPPGPGDHFIQSSLGSNMLCLRTHGEVRFEDGGGRIRSIAPGAWLVLAVLTEDGVQRMEITAGPEGPEYAWIVNGEARPIDDRARAWRDAMLTTLGGRLATADIRSQVARLRSEIGRARGDEARRHAEIAQLRSVLARFESELARAQGEEARLRAEIASIRAVEARLGSEAARIRAEAARGGSELARMQERAGALETAGRVTGDPETRARLMAEAEAVRARMAEAEPELPAEAAAALEELEERIEAHRRASEPRIRELDLRIEAIAEARREGAEPERAERRRQVEAQVAEITEAIEALGRASRVQELERRIRELDAERRVRELELRQESEREALRRLIREIG